MSKILPVFILCTIASAPAAWTQEPSQAWTDARAACQSDLQKFCTGVAPGGGRMLACLKQHKEEVSPGCKEAVIKALQGPGAAPSPPASLSPNPPDQSSASPSAGAAAAATPSHAPAVTAAASSKVAHSASTANAQPAAHAGGGPARYYELKRVTAMMKLDPAPSSPPVDANHEAKIFSLLAPTDWSLAGGFTNKADAGSCFSDMIQVRGVAKSSDGTYGMVVIPQSTFRYADDPAVRQQWEQRDRFDEKYKLKGCPIVAPMHAADFIREYLVWKFHKDRPQVTSEPFPELEQLARVELGLGPKAGGAGGGATRVEAARVRASATTTDKGDPIDEWWSAVIVVHPVPVAGRGVAYDWHAEQVTVFETPRGKLDSYDKLYRVMATSVRIDPQFQAWNSGFINQIYTQWAREVQKQNAIVAAFQQHVIETIQGVTTNQQHGSMVAAYGADQLVRGVQTFRDPSTGRTVELSNLYDHAWANGNDKYIVTDDPNFNPNGHINGDWDELQLVRPQP